MVVNVPLCKITVLKRTFHQDLIHEYLEEESQPSGPCECFEDGEEFLINPSKASEEFYTRCPWAWADIYKDILTIASGASMIGVKQPGILITGCSDWFRSVIFKIERLD